MDAAIFHKVTTCGMDMEKPVSESCSVTKKDCCNEEQVVVDGQDELQLSFNKISFEQQVFIASFVYSYINLFEDVDENTVPFRDYNPPFLIRDIQKLHETYLIWFLVVGCNAEYFALEPFHVWTLPLATS